MNVNLSYQPTQKDEYDKDGHNKSNRPLTRRMRGTLLSTFIPWT